MNDTNKLTICTGKISKFPSVAVPIYWEENSFSKALASVGKIGKTALWKKSSTYNFPANAATVRVTNISSKFPTAVIHIKDEARKTSYGNGQHYMSNSTLRVTVGGESRQDPNKARAHMLFNGDTSTYTMGDVASLIQEVRQTMGL